MKVLLINPGNANEALEAPPLGLAYVASAAERAGHTIDVLDLGVNSPHEVRAVMAQPYQVVGITATSYWYYEAVRLALLFKQSRPSVWTVLGGPHASIDPEGCASDGAFDFVVRGEGERTFAELLEVLADGSPKGESTMKSIRGLAVRWDGGAFLTKPRDRLKDLDALPMPAYHLLEMDRYKAHAVLASRGCPFRCAFCAVNHIWGQKWRSRTPESVAVEMQYLVDEYGLKETIVQDDTFNANIPRAIRLCELIGSRLPGLYWTAQGVRADRMTNDLAVAMSDTGCSAVGVGIESADEEVLRLMHKGESIEDIERGLGYLKRHLIPVHGQFIIGNAGDTPRSIRCSLSFARRVHIEAPTFNMALPYPGTELWNWVHRNGRFLVDDYKLFSHHSASPVFETAEFSAGQRSRALVEARRLEWLARLRFNVPMKLRRRARCGHLDTVGMWRDGQKLVRGALLRLRRPYSGPRR